jgi:TRAP-type uncharacterized transport system substrate-binding protein
VEDKNILSRVAAPEKRKRLIARLLAPFIETFGFTRSFAIVVVLFIGSVLLLSVFWFIHSAPPKIITITAGMPGSSFETNAVKYREILARSGITLKILPSQGSMENLERLSNPAFKVDIGFVQGGVTNESPAQNSEKLTSLGSIGYQPLMVFCRGTNQVALLSELNGKRFAIGPVGSGTRTLALAILKLNDIEQGTSTLLDLDGGSAAKALLEGKVDAIFLMGDSASPKIMVQLLKTPGVQLLDFIQADGYTRKISYLNKLSIPKGAMDFAKDIPSHDIALIGPTLEILARSDFHPALVDLVIEAAQEVHGGASILKKKKEFPASIEHDYTLNNEAARYYKSGKSLLYKYLPFWLASLLNRVVVAFIPAIVVLIPGMKLIPFLFRLRIKLRLYRWYRALLAVERDSLIETAGLQRDHLLGRLDHIEAGVNRMKVPASFGDQFYALRVYIRFVRDRILNPKAIQPSVLPHG